MLFSNFPKHLFSFVSKAFQHFNYVQMLWTQKKKKKKDPKASEDKRIVLLYLAFGQALLGNSGIGLLVFSFVCLLVLVWFSC